MPQEPEIDINKLLKYFRSERGPSKFTSLFYVGMLHKKSINNVFFAVVFAYVCTLIPRSDCKKVLYPLYFIIEIETTTKLRKVNSDKRRISIGTFHPYLL